MGFGVLDKVFLGASAVDGVKKGNKQFKGADNPYDRIMGGEIIKASTKNGEMNALNSPNSMYRNASEEIEELCKEAGFTDAVKKATKPVKDVSLKIIAPIKSQGKKVSNKLGEADRKAFRNIDRIKLFEDAYARTGDIKYKKKANQYRMSAAKFFAPAAGVTVAGGAGATAILKKIDNKKKKDNNDNIANAGDNAYPYVAGAALTGAATYNALANKSVFAPLENMGKGLKKGLYSHPKRMVGKAGKAGKMVVNVLKAVKDKTAETIDDLYFEKMAVTKRQIAKDVIKGDFIQRGISSIPYFAAPAAISGVIGRDIRHGGRKIRDTYDNSIVIDVPIDNIKSKTTEKTAEALPWGKFFKDELPRRTVQGVSRSIFPTAVVAVTGRNITNAMEKVNDKDEKLAPLEEGKARMIIQINPEGEKSEKRASDILDEIYKESKTEDSSDIEKDTEKTIQDAKENKKKDEGSLASIHLAHGIKKREKMLR